MRDAVLIFDGDCGFCSRVVEWIFARVGPGVRAVPFQVFDLEANGIPEDRVRREVVWLSPGGETRGGVDALSAVLAAATSRHLRAIGRWSTAFPVARPARLAYRVVARNRHRLPGGTGTCRIRA
ncbi:DCC1-like thiol-disulfide oxidoreductase family protein [Actinosynnema sp. NPDC020468]|uniref:thiol-disulfide oxidoreductase DCC family protein n=1 Tax=Actinosynnema sp. NPDC020468 TaxID=3154488 RepID=UPI0033FC2B5B